MEDRSEQGGGGAILYGSEYFQSHCGPIPYTRDQPHWLRFFSQIAEHIISSLAPKRVLDAGCAMGFLVETLRDRGVEAYGLDLSEYAISQVRQDLAPYCKVASLAEPIAGRFDLITCIEVLEHLTEEESRKAILNMSSATDANGLASRGAAAGQKSTGKSVPECPSRTRSTSLTPKSYQDHLS